jgi:hypothetical protein
VTLSEQLWRTSDRARHFIIPDAAERRDGDLRLESLSGEEAGIDPGWVYRYEVTADEAHAWAKQEFGIALGEIRRRIDAKLGRMRISLDAAKRTPARPEHDIARDALPALLSLAKALPRAILDGLSGDPARVTNAHDALDGIEQRLNHAGIAVGDRLSAFPDRLAGLRAEIGRSRAGASPPSPDDQGEERR